MAASAFADDCEVFNDPAHDAVLRRTDTANCGTFNTAQALPDVRSLRIGAWTTATGTTNPYNGSYVDHDGGHLVRIDVILGGVINPPGPLGLSGQAYDPFVFGNSPIYGFFDFDVDNDRDTGGDGSLGEASHHYLANVARFATRPQGPMASRAATLPLDLNESFDHPPQVQLSGADWTLAFCGCFFPTPVYKNDPNATTFGAGSTWIMEGRFFHRTTAYRGASLMTGGSLPGLYDPVVRVRFRHSICEDTTTISLVYPLDDIGSVALTGTPSQQFNRLVQDHNSIAESVYDLIEAAHSPLEPTSLAFHVTDGWRSKSVLSAVDVERWRPTFIVGTAYDDPCDGLYAWTDVGPGNQKGDLNGDGRVDSLDRALVVSAIEENDGTNIDADQAINGQVRLFSVGWNFSLYDVDSDGTIGPLDVAFFPTAVCRADFNSSGTLTPQDIFDFLSAWFSAAPNADVDNSGGLSVQDIFTFLSAWFAGC